MVYGGDAFAVAAIVYDIDGKELDKICLRLPNTVINDKYTEKNVLPTLNSPITHRTYGYTNMLKDFADFYIKYKDATAYISHSQKANILRDSGKFEIHPFI